MLRKMPQGIFIFGGKWQMRPFRFRPLFAPERKRFFKPFHVGKPHMECLFIR